jgi:acetyl esterase
VEHRRFDGQIHGFFSMVNMLPGSAAALDYIAENVRRLLDPPS